MKHQFNLFYSLGKLLSNTALFFLKKRSVHILGVRESTHFHFLPPFLEMECQGLQNVCHSGPSQRVTKEVSIQDTLTRGQTKTRPCFQSADQLHWGHSNRTVVGKGISHLENGVRVLPHTAIPAGTGSLLVQPFRTL